MRKHLAAFIASALVLVLSAGAEAAVPASSGGLGAPVTAAAHMALVGIGDPGTGPQFVETPYPIGCTTGLNYESATKTFSCLAGGGGADGNAKTMCPDGQVLFGDDASTRCVAIPTCNVAGGEVLTFNGTVFSCVTVSGGGAGHTIQDEGTGVPAETNLNFVGAGVACVDDPANNATKCTITGAGFTPNADPGVDHSGYVAGHGAGDNLTLNGTDFDFDGIRFDAAGTDQGVFNGISMGSDFTPTKVLACVGGTDPGNICTTNADCASGTCTTDKGIQWTLNSTVYNQNDTILGSDLSNALRLATSGTVTTGVTHTYNSGASIVMNGALDAGGGTSEIPNGTAAAPTALGQEYLDTDGAGGSGMAVSSVGDGTYAKPTPTCWIERFGSIFSGTQTFYLNSPNNNAAFGVSTSSNPAKFSYPYNMRVAWMYCSTQKELTTGDTITADIVTATKTGCTYTDGASHSGCTFTDAGLTDCAITGTASGLQAESECESKDQNLQLLSTEWINYRIVAVGVPTSTHITCSALVCMEGPW